MDRRRGYFLVGAILLTWGSLVTFAASTGFYNAVNPMAVGPMVVAGIIAPFVAYRRISMVRRAVDSIGLRAITAFHIWRIGAAVLFFWYGAHGLLPAVFARNAGWGDLIAGSLALIVLLLPERRALYAVFHLVGFADFIDAIGTALFFTVQHDPRMAAIRVLPLALIPLFGVGVSGASHLIAFDMLRRRVGLTRTDFAAAMAPAGAR
jgi:hypothetical protein